MVRSSDLSKLHLEFDDISETGDDRLDIVCVVSVEHAPPEDMPVSLRSRGADNKVITLEADERSVSTHYVVPATAQSVRAFYGYRRRDYDLSLRSESVRISGWSPRDTSEVSDPPPSSHSSSSDGFAEDDEPVSHRDTDETEQSTPQQERGHQQEQSDTPPEPCVPRRQSSLLVSTTEVQPGDYVLVVSMQPAEEGKPILCTTVRRDGTRETREHATDRYGRTDPITVSVAKQERHLHVVLEALDTPTYTIRLFNHLEMFESLTTQQTATERIQQCSA